MVTGSMGRSSGAAPASNEYDPRVRLNSPRLIYTHTHRSRKKQRRESTNHTPRVSVYSSSYLSLYRMGFKWAFWRDDPPAERPLSQAELELQIEELTEQSDQRVHDEPGEAAVESNVRQVEYEEFVRLSKQRAAATRPPEPQPIRSPYVIPDTIKATVAAAGAEAVSVVAKQAAIATAAATVAAAKSAVGQTTFAIDDALKALKRNFTALEEPHAAHTHSHADTLIHRMGGHRLIAISHTVYLVGITILISILALAAVYCLYRIYKHYRKLGRAYNASRGRVIHDALIAPKQRSNTTLGPGVDSHSEGEADEGEPEPESEHAAPPPVVPSTTRQRPIATAAAAAIPRANQQLSSLASAPLRSVPRPQQQQQQQKLYSYVAPPTSFTGGNPADNVFGTRQGGGGNGYQ